MLQSISLGLDVMLLLISLGLDVMRALHPHPPSGQIQHAQVFLIAAPYTASHIFSCVLCTLEPQGPLLPFLAVSHRSQQYEPPM